MARKKSSSADVQERPELSVSLDEASGRIENQIRKGRETPDESVNENDEARRWYDFTAELLRRLFTTDALRDEFTGRGRYGGDINTGTFLKRLISIHERLELYPESPEARMAQSSSRHSDGDVSRELPTKVFLVHGHEEGARESTARFLEKLGLEVIVLHEQASAGRTIIEKLEAHSDVDFALILLTPDDLGAVATSPRELMPRARQNVILELGYFFGLLGRTRVCALHKGDVELPSDYHGIVYISMDEGGAWKLLVGRELRNAGFDIDLNLVA